MLTFWLIPQHLGRASKKVNCGLTLLKITAFIVANYYNYAEKVGISFELKH